MNTLDETLSAKNGLQVDTGLLKSFRDAHTRQALDVRIHDFTGMIEMLRRSHQLTYFRLVTSPTGREVTVQDNETGDLRCLLMFASNNYLGLANHPYVVKKVKEAIDAYGIGVAGPPLLNGYTFKMKELEERIAAFKHQEDAMVFSTGFAANLGLVGALAAEGDCIVFDALSHASLYDALKQTPAEHIKFAHNDMQALDAILRMERSRVRDLFVAVEGVYSMDGDLAPLDRVVQICERYGATCWLDDAHGTGVMGERGEGTSDHFGVTDRIGVCMGTFSKALAVTGGFLAASRDLITYMRYYARPYMFSAALPPMNLAAVLAGFDVIEREPERRRRLHAIVRYARGKLEGKGIFAPPGAAIIALKVPAWMDIRKANYQLYRKGIFLNAIEYPAVALDQQRFRISFMADHTTKDIDRLAEVLDEVWEDTACRFDGIPAD